MAVDPDGFNINRDCGATVPEPMQRPWSPTAPTSASPSTATPTGDPGRRDRRGDRRRPADGPDRPLLGRAGRLTRRRRRRDGDVEPWPRALPRGLGLALLRTPVGDRYVVEEMRAGAATGRRAVRPHRALRLHDHRRRLDRGAAGAGRAGRASTAGERGHSGLRALCRSCSRTSASTAARRWTTPGSRPHRRGRERAGRGGRLLIRKSGTEPVIRVMAEGEDEALVGRVVERHREDHRRGRRAAGRLSRQGRSMTGTGSDRRRLRFRRRRRHSGRHQGGDRAGRLCRHGVTALTAQNTPGSTAWSGSSPRSSSSRCAWCSRTSAPMRSRPGCCTTPGDRGRRPRFWPARSGAACRRRSGHGGAERRLLARARGGLTLLRTACCPAPRPDSPTCRRPRRCSGRRSPKRATGCSRQP